MKNAEKVLLDFEVDKLTNSIENAITGEVFDTDIIEMKASDLKQLKKADWQFDWHKELKRKTEGFIN